jgi:nitrite reductase/ring-hydroxylating ferredoxin subunit
MSFGVGWYPLALSDGLEAARSAGTRLFDRELCIWRDSDGQAHAWEDRCPHRGMRLSFGFVRGNRIACLYHGWQYDTRGQCRLIPAHPDLDVPATIRVATYPCVERLGMLWVYSDRAIDTPPDLPVEAREVTPVRSLYVDREPAQVMQALAAQPENQNGGSGGVTLLSLDAGGQVLLAGVQPFGPAKTALHMVLPGAPAPRCGAARHAAAAWAEQLRRTLEAGPRATAKAAVTHETVL